MSIENDGFTPEIIAVCKTAARDYIYGTKCAIWTLEDAEQEAFAAALQILKSGKRYALGTLRTILFYRLIDQYRKETKSRRVDKETRPKIALFPSDCAKDEPGDLLREQWEEKTRYEPSTTSERDFYYLDDDGKLAEFDDEIFKHVVKLRLKKADNRTRTMFKLYYEGGLTYLEIAKRVELSEAAVGERLRKFVKAIRDSYMRKARKVYGK